MQLHGALSNYKGRVAEASRWTPDKCLGSRAHSEAYEGQRSADCMVDRLHTFHHDAVAAAAK